MRQNIIVLWGNANCGKSTTIKLVADLLEGNSSNTIDYSNGGNDIVKTFMINRKKVGLISAGDSQKEIENAIVRIGTKCDCYVLASRSKGHTVNYIRKIFLKQRIIWSSKWIMTSDDSEPTFSVGALQNLVNNRQAVIIKETVEKLLLED